MKGLVGQLSLVMPGGYGEKGLVGQLNWVGVGEVMAGRVQGKGLVGQLQRAAVLGRWLGRQLAAKWSRALTWEGIG
jgi:hypothetical protein